MSSVNWKHTGRTAGRVVGAAVGTAAGYAVGGVAGAIGGGSAGFTGGGAIMDALFPDPVIKVPSVNYGKFNIQDSYNPYSKNKVEQVSYTTQESGKDFDAIMQGADVLAQTVGSLGSGLGGTKSKISDIGIGTTRNEDNDSGSSLVDAGIKNVAGSSSRSLLSGISLGNEDYLAQAGSALKNFAPNDYKPLQAKIKTKNSLYNYNTLLTV